MLLVDEILDKHVVTWNTMVTCSANNQWIGQALDLRDESISMKSRMLADNSLFNAFYRCVCKSGNLGSSEHIFVAINYVKNDFARNLMKNGWVHNNNPKRCL